MYCISINHKNASAEIRSRFAFSRGKRQEISAALSEHGIKQSVIVCTCNRTELYFIGSDIGCTDTAAEILTKYSGEEPTAVSLCLRSYYGEKALAHLFRVACGIDSMIIGEDVSRPTRLSQKRRFPPLLLQLMKLLLSAAA